MQITRFKVNWNWLLDDNTSFHVAIIQDDYELVSLLLFKCKYKYKKP